MNFMSSHLSERIAEFVFEELSTAEMAEGKRHLAECSDCRMQVEDFRRTHAFLKTSPDVEPPRRIIFEIEKPRFAPWAWRWLAPMAASAAVAFAVVTLTPRPQPQPQIVERFVQPQLAAQPAVQPVDYQKIVNEALATELKKRDAAQAREILRVRTDIAYLDAQQRKNRNETMEDFQQMAANVGKVR